MNKMQKKSVHGSKKRDSMICTDMKSLSKEEQEPLRRALLKASEMKPLNSAESSSVRMLWLKKKIQLCLVQCDWNKKDEPLEAKLIANKRKVLLEILEFYGQRKFKSMDLLKHSFRLIWLNLFRALPDPTAIRTAPSDEEMDFREPAWDHLVLIYEIAFHVVTNTEIDKKIMQKYLRGKFLQNLINLFHSLDDREPQYVKIILHAIYGRFMALRRDIRQYLAQYCLSYIYDTKCELFDSNTSILWQGVPEILAIFCSIIQGLNVPVKQDYHLLLRNVLVPLHKTYHVDAFHEELIQCCTQFIVKDVHSAAVIFGGMLKFWPTMSPLKEQLFIDEIVHLLNACSDYMEQFGCNKSMKQQYIFSRKELQFEEIIISVINRLCKCMFSEHHQVSERALLVWKEDSLRLCLEVFGDKCWSTVYSALKKLSTTYWLPDIRNISKSVLIGLQSTNPQFFKSYTSTKYIQKLEKRQKFDENYKRKERENKWRQVQQLAIHQINK
eukprot:CAMPEP_0197023346 /NCGR_PEP_ID=MMETSP1384-20130603/4052_1 /TAXON_ID=29189 /ORGANISM="Ammonia sp." /LENGTH=496 /DNA_ID=CAMNT_0042451543 /DNA_START=76 /DNA_END=1566 /DNA_ORIENTATION=+